MLELRQVTKRYGALTVLDRLDLNFPKNGVVALLGPSGCGKTTLLRLIAGLEAPGGGEIKKPHGVRISMVFQEDRLLPGLSARENILAVLPPGKDSEARAEEALAACGLSSCAEMPPSEHSGGMQRRIAIARAIVFGGEILLLDEPFKGLDPDTKEDVARFVLGARNSSLTLMVTHSTQEAERCADTILRLDGPPLRVGQR